MAKSTGGTQRAAAHFPIEAWLDYARGVGSAWTRAQLSRHAALCDRCARLSGLLSGLGATLRADLPVVPREVVKAAEAIFTVPHPSMREPRRALSERRSPSRGKRRGKTPQ